MKALGIVLSVFGGLMVLSGINLVRLGKFDLSPTEGLQQFVGGVAFGIILVAVGLALANRKKPISKATNGHGYHLNCSSFSSRVVVPCGRGLSGRSRALVIHRGPTRPPSDDVDEVRIQVDEFGSPNKSRAIRRQMSTAEPKALPLQDDYPRLTEDVEALFAEPVDECLGARPFVPDIAE
jgi:hypothetical protein